MIFSNDLKSFTLEGGNNSLDLNCAVEVNFKVLEFSKLTLFDFGVLKEVAAPDNDKLLVNFGANEFVLNFLVNGFNLLL